MTVSNYSTTAANNTTINSISIAEGMPPSNVNNAMRNQLSDIRSFLNDKEWFIVGDRDGACTFARASGTSVTVASTNVTADYHANRRVKVVGANTGTLYGKVASSSFSTNTTINFTFDSGTISGSDTNVDVFVGSPFTNPAIPVIDDNSLGTSTVLPPSQSSVKNFVENLVTAQDLDISDGSTAIAIDLDSETLGLLGGTGIDSTASGNNVTMAIDSTVVTKTGTQTLTNKTLTTPVISSISNTGTVTLPTSSDTLVGKATTDTLTNKTINLANNTLTGTTAQFNSSLSDGSFATLTGTESLTNKTLSSPTINDPTINSGSGTLAVNLSTNPLEIKQSGTNTVLELNKNTSTHGVVLSVEQQGTSYGTINTDISGSTKKLQIGAVGELIVRANNGELVETISSSGAGNGLVAINGNVTASNLGTISSQASNNVAITGGSITGLGSPSNNSDVAIKSYVDNLVTGLKTRIIVRAATTGNIDLTQDLQNGDTLDGVTLATDDKVLVKDQSNNTQNGVYKVVASGTASRDPDFDTVDELAGQMIIVKEGSVNADSFHLCTTDSGSIPTAAITFTQVTPSSGGTVTQVGIAQAGSEFTISGSPITTSGNITLGIGTIANTKISGLGTASTKAVGTSADNVVQLDGSARLPAVDGSQLTNLPTTGATNGFAIAMAVAL
jgi:hypothetical protein